MVDRERFKDPEGNVAWLAVKLCFWLWAVSAFASLVLTGAIVYAVVHFLIKFW